MSSSPAADVVPLFVSDPGTSRKHRLLSVDIFRGLCVAGMILVTNPGTYEYDYGPLRHAEWNGATPTDMIFPSFLFLAGVAMCFSFAARLTRGERTGQGTGRLVRHIFSRSAALIVLGVLLNCFDLIHLTDLRLPGVLQRIGLCYCLGGLIYFASGRLAQNGRKTMQIAGILASILVLMSVYWALQKLVPVPGYGVGRLDPEGTLSAYIDRAVFTTKHLWHWGGPGQVWDPEGLLTTLPAIGNLLLGVLAGEWLTGTSKDAGTKRKWMYVAGMVVCGALMIGAALMLDPVIPINKKIWTPSFVLLSGGFSLAALGLLYGVVDGAQERRWRKICTPALIFGSNAILGFALANAVSPLIGLIKLPAAAGGFTGPNGFVFEHLLRWMNPWNASLAYAVLFVLLIMMILWPLYRKGIFVRL